ncbi:hypothetical protein HZU40_17045 [Mycolicibacterium fluoranthenivorans]|jgi:hypothetical protein|uniref:ESX-1 secretion-associated protein n=1 Tax=Mycolicibacterium fluoranthenivorans TaxID=258505 RepID=A0A7G8PN56_9MYCO|nr:hypothetical protein [Mycolicibacterium fluoranthenivorans]QNJ95772.1 hypothetical protein HZU40_17045 [Mycolicibacterium fluoranthenivorans]
MSDDDLHIEPEAVAASGQRLSELAGAAKVRNATYFTSQSPAAQGNPGFTSGSALVAFADVLHKHMDGFVDDLAHNSGEIIAAAQSVRKVDGETADGFNRELAALNGLAKHP